MRNSDECPRESTGDASRLARLRATAAKVKGRSSAIQADSRRIAQAGEEIRRGLREQRERLVDGYEAIRARRNARHAPG
ncbi:hypothetical protein [Spongiactinospora sp. TRM90649]|uniref:hypothetical protein n=1 Tax=Spongiactinospora sp. TRM90649 TaxID=3031114 RepID=UPI0023F79ED4|nr:hypothetical protein [Spongiactinospora sp. TRM90649]MDF5754703.1 hypothetical protein [Spongiactinospora sp. TRM90649]